MAGHSIGGHVVAQMAAISAGSFKKIIIMSGSVSPYLEKKDCGAT
jgi:pimeloyl-ACP methyl ester carboxylesterase